MILAVKDSAENLSISIEKPREGYIYIFDREICKIPSEKAVIIGKITVKAKAYGNISKVEFYIDDKLKSTDNEYPYEWLWSEKTFLNHEIKVVAYDINGDKAEDFLPVKMFGI